MADRLVQLQDDVRRQERQAMFGKIAAGLVHDLSHPIQTIVTNSKLIIRMFDDAEYRDTFKRMIERESLVIKRVLEDLRNIAQPIPLEHFPVDIDRSVADVVESLKVPAETAGVSLRAELGSVGALVQGDVFALGRVYRNLLINAIQATAPGGDVAIAPRRRPSGCGSRSSRRGLRIARPDCGDLRRLRDDQAPRARAGAGDFEEDCRAARRADLCHERGREGNDVVLEFPRRLADRPGGRAPLPPFGYAAAR
jgi:signal transduction histidine kinase